MAAKKKSNLPIKGTDLKQAAFASAAFIGGVAVGSFVSDKIEDGIDNLVPNPQLAGGLKMLGGVGIVVAAAVVGQRKGLDKIPLATVGMGLASHMLVEGFGDLTGLNFDDDEPVQIETEEAEGTLLINGVNPDMAGFIQYDNDYAYI